MTIREFNQRYMPMSVGAPRMSFELKLADGGCLRISCVGDCAIDMSDNDAMIAHIAKEFKITKNNWKERSVEAIKKFGAEMQFKCGDNERTESPVESLGRMFPDKPVITG